MWILYYSCYKTRVARHNEMKIDKNEPEVWKCKNAHSTTDWRSMSYKAVAVSSRYWPISTPWRHIGLETIGNEKNRPPQKVESSKDYSVFQPFSCLLSRLTRTCSIFLLTSSLSTTSSRSIWRIKVRIWRLFHVKKTSVFRTIIVKESRLRLFQVSKINIINALKGFNVSGSSKQTKKDPKTSSR